MLAARAIQSERFKDEPKTHCNAMMSSRLIRKYCRLDEASEQMLEMAMTRLGLSARAYDRILKVSRTIADLEGAPDITMNHLREAISYRAQRSRSSEFTRKELDKEEQWL